MSCNYSTSDNNLDSCSSKKDNISNSYINIPNDILCLIAKYCKGEDLTNFIGCYPKNIALKRFLMKRIEVDYLVPITCSNTVKEFIKKAIAHNIPLEVIYLYIKRCSSDLFGIEYLMKKHLLYSIFSTPISKLHILGLIRFFLKKMLFYKEMFLCSVEDFKSYNKMFLLEENFIKINGTYQTTDLFLIALNCLEYDSCKEDYLLAIILGINEKIEDYEYRRMLYEKVFNLIIKHKIGVDFMALIGKNCILKQN